MIQTLAGLHQYSHETQRHDEDITKENAGESHSKIFDYGILLPAAGIIYNLLNINWIVSLLNFIMYGLLIINHLRQDELYGGKTILFNYVRAFNFLLLIFAASYYNDIKTKKRNFLLQLKIFRLIKEQNTIFDQQPDGIVLF